jgi:O-antigen ligase
VVYYQSAIVVAPLSRPENIFQTNGVYDNALVLGQLSIVPTVDIALLASIGFILYYSFLAECQKLQINGIIFCILAFISLIIINSCGQRVFIFGIPIVMSIMLLYPHRNYRFLVMSMLSMSIALAIIVYQSILSNNYRYELIMSLDTGIFERFDRVINWSAAIDRIREYPYFGHGLGGYYIEGLSSPGEEYWAHNIFLEIASEMGLIFLIALIIPVIILLLKFGKKLFHIRAADGTLLSPIFLIIFIQSIFSQDLRETVILLPFTAIFWINSVTLRNGNC